MADRLHHLYRGVNLPYTPGDDPDPATSPYDFLSRNLNRNQLGIHWTSDPEVAADFAHSDIGFDDGTLAQPTVLHARVPASMVVDPSSDEFDQYAERHGVTSPGDGWSSLIPDEHEHTVRSGSPVLVHAADLLGTGRTSRRPFVGLAYPGSD